MIYIIYFHPVNVILNFDSFGVGGRVGLGVSFMSTRSPTLTPTSKHPHLHTHIHILTSHPPTPFVYGLCISPYTATEIYDCNTGSCYTAKYSRIRSVYSMYTVVHGVLNDRPGLALRYLVLILVLVWLCLLIYYKEYLIYLFILGLLTTGFIVGCFIIICLILKSLTHPTGHEIDFNSDSSEKDSDDSSEQLLISVGDQNSSDDTAPTESHQQHTVVYLPNGHSDCTSADG